MCNGSAGKATDKRMGTAGRNAKPPGNKVPGNGSYKARAYYGQRYKCHACRIMAFFNRFCNSIGYAMILKNKKSNKVEKCRPKYRLKRRKHFGGNNGSYGI